MSKVEVVSEGGYSEVVIGMVNVAGMVIAEVDTITLCNE